jgi:hypothetical protein
VAILSFLGLLPRFSPRNDKLFNDFRLDKAASMNPRTEEGDGISLAVTFWLQKRQRSRQPTLGRKTGMMIGATIIVWIVKFVNFVKRSKRLPAVGRF